MTLGADLSSKQVEVEGSFVPAELATQLSRFRVLIYRMF